MSGLFQSLLSTLSSGGSNGDSIDVHALHQAIEAGDVALLVDVRTPGEFAGGHVPQAVNIPLPQVADPANIAAWEGRVVHLICRSGARSGRAQASLADLGVQTVNVRGGTDGWRAAGYPVA